MLNILFSELVRLRHRLPPLIAFLLILCFIGQGLITYRTGHWFNYNDIYSSYLAYLLALSGTTAFWVGVIPLIASLIAGDSLAWDRKTGFIRFFLMRTTRRNYILGKVIAVFLLTGIIVLCGLLISFGIACLCFPLQLPPWHMVGNIPTFTNPAAPLSYINLWPSFLHNLFFAHPFRYVLIVIGIVTLSSTFWALISLFFSLWTTNIYIVLAGPWLVYIIDLFIKGILGIGQYAALVLSGPFVSNSVSGSGNLAGSKIPVIWVIAIVMIATATSAVFLKRRDILD